MSDDQKPGPSTLTCALAGLGGAAAVYGVLYFFAGKKTGFGATRTRKDTLEYFSGMPVDYTDPDPNREQWRDDLITLVESYGGKAERVFNYVRAEIPWSSPSFFSEEFYSAVRSRGYETSSSDSPDKLVVDIYNVER